MTEVTLELAKLIGYVALFLGLCVLALIPLTVYRKASFAVMKRNFLAYFSNPTGYLFLCIFVCLVHLSLPTIFLTRTWRISIN